MEVLAIRGLENQQLLTILVCVLCVFVCKIISIQANAGTIFISLVMSAKICMFIQTDTQTDESEP